MLLVGKSLENEENPADPDATYRVKAGKEHRGYAANVVEAVDQTGCVIVDYQYEVNKHI